MAKTLIQGLTAIAVFVGLAGVRRRKRILGALQVLSHTMTFAILLITNESHAALLNFDFNNEAVGVDPNTLVSKGIVFDYGEVGPGMFPGIGAWIAGTEDLWMANNGTNYMALDYFNKSRVNIYSNSSEVFDLKRLDLGEAYIASLVFENDGRCSETYFAGPYRVAFTGYIEGGDIISRTVALDMVCDGAGPLIDFETIEFDVHWSRLEMLTIQQLTLNDTPESFLGIDNLVLRVSEPGAAALLGLGLAGLAFTRRRESWLPRRRPDFPLIAGAAR